MLFMGLIMIFDLVFTLDGYALDLFCGLRVFSGDYFLNVTGSLGLLLLFFCFSYMVVFRVFGVLRV